MTMSKLRLVGLVTLLTCLAGFHTEPRARASGVPGGAGPLPSPAIVPYAPHPDDVRPDLPAGADAADPFPATTSRLALTVTFPTPAIAAQLEAAIPRSFHIDTRPDGWHVYGDPRRGSISVVSDVAGRRVSASTPVSGRIQVSRRVIINALFIHINQEASVGIDVSGAIAASVSPVLAPNWDVNPQLGLSADVNHAEARTFLGGIDITGHVRGPVSNAVNGVRGDVQNRMKQLLDLRTRCTRLWAQLNSVHRLGDDPPIWLRVTPRQATFAGFQYTGDAIRSGLTIDLEAHAYVQDQAPPIVKSTLPDLHLGGPMGDGFVLSVPVEIPHAEVSRQLKAQLTRGPIKMNDDLSVEVSDASISSYKGGVLLAIDFTAKQGEGKLASGHLYITGDVTLDAGSDEVRLSKLAFTAETRDALKKQADWLARAEIPNAVAKTVVIKLGDGLADVKDKANAQVQTLNAQLPREFAVHLAVTDFHVTKVTFARDRTFAVVTARGKSSATLRP
jgi:hypothetical protein